MARFWRGRGWKLDFCRVGVWEFWVWDLIRAYALVGWDLFGGVWD